MMSTTCPPGHVAFGSIRMEPVDMIPGQSAAVASVMAIAADADIQDADYAELRGKLLEFGQKLSWPSLPDH